MYCRGMTRTERLRLAKTWTQPQLADYLGVRQATVSRLENGQDESGPVSRLLDLLEAELLVASSAAAVPPATASERVA